MSASTMQSNVEEIARLWIYPVPVKPINVVRAARSGKATVLLDDKGKVYSSVTTQSWHFPVYMRTESMSDTYAACVKLGVISKEALAQHEAYSAMVRGIRDKKSRADELMKNAASLGVKLTAAQQRKVMAALNAVVPTAHEGKG